MFFSLAIVHRKSDLWEGEKSQENIQFLIRIQLSAQNEQLENDKKNLNYSVG